MSLKDPRSYPWKANSPYEIYASGRWFGSREDPVWRSRARRWAELHSPVYRGELNGYRTSAVSLVKELFFLHLTVRAGSPEISEGLKLLKTMEGSKEHLGKRPWDIPFEPAEDTDFILHAWLFSTAVFGEAAAPAWREAAEKQGQIIETLGDTWSSGSLYNFLRGTLV
ncbi:MAG: hypothetical protein JW760_08450, partial [Spirochaetales bacterium]|nr:hypothetical protein [Spirochaetales bacterium]